MNDAKARLWCDALRSGKYIQGKRGLYNHMTKRHCCLGVVEELQMNANVNWITQDDYEFAHNGNYRTTINTVSLSIDTMYAMGMDSQYGSIKGLKDRDGVENNALSELNDYMMEPFNFDQIADIIWYFRSVL